MDPASSVLIFVEPRIGVPFGVALCLGLVAACGFWLLRPWPPQRGRVAGFSLTLVLGLAGSAALLRHAEVRIDAAAQRVLDRQVILGLGSGRSWAFDQIRAVVVERPGADTPGSPPATRFRVLLETPDGALELRRHDDVQAAESEGWRVARAGAWPLLRRGYRVESTPVVGERQPLVLPDGRRGYAVDLGPVLRVVEAPGASERLNP